MTLFFVGIIEMIIVALWTRFVTQANILMSGVITIINIFIWYYVIQTVVDNLGDWTTIVPYALGCAIGTMLGTASEKGAVYWKNAYAKLVKTK
jgi:uncharacterized protein YebE (UPF0316 family)